MARPNRSNERREELLPVIARTFVRLGYRRATTAALAQACQVQETILYRLWADKKAMFIAAIEHVYEVSTGMWAKLLGDGDDGKSAAERLLEYESTHHGEFGMYRIVFAGLSESDDEDIRAALCSMYERYHEFIGARLSDHRSGDVARIDGELSAWAIIGLGTITAIGRELGLLDGQARSDLWNEPGRLLLEGRRD
jgi:AcrR family transcriptional regulator